MRIKGKGELLKILNIYWEKDYIPVEWKTGNILPLHKKVDKMECFNYIRVTFLCVAFMVIE